MRRKVIVGNWKMNNLSADVTNFMNEINQNLEHMLDVEVGVCVPSVYLSMIDKTGVLKIGAQNMHYESMGAYTGEVSGEMLKDVGSYYVIIGHSERRMYYNETCETVNLKLKKALDVNLVPIVCCGESLEQYNNGETKQVVESQIKKAFQGVNSIENVIIAYEPIWAIGTGLSASSEDANNMCKFIRSVLADIYGDASKVIIQYGGSVKPDNIKEYLSMSDIDGALVGGASVKPHDYLNLISAIK